MERQDGERVWVDRELAAGQMQPRHPRGFGRIDVHGDDRDQGQDQRAPCDCGLKLEGRAGRAGVSPIREAHPDETGAIAVPVRGSDPRDSGTLKTGGRLRATVTHASAQAFGSSTRAHMVGRMVGHGSESTTQCRCVPLHEPLKRVRKAAHFFPKRGTQIPPFDEWEQSSNEHILWFMKIEARAWAADASLNEDTSPYDVTRRYFSGHRRRWASWGRAVGRHGPSLWFAAVVLVLSLSLVKACTSTPAQTPSSPRYHSRGYAQ